MTNTILTVQEETLLSTLQSILQGSKWCLFLAAKQNIKKFGGILPALVVKDIPGEQVLSIPLGQNEIVILGQDEDSAFIRIDAMNKALGLDNYTVASICNSAGLDIFTPKANLQQKTRTAAYS